MQPSFCLGLHSLVVLHSQFGGCSSDSQTLLVRSHCVQAEACTACKEYLGLQCVLMDVPCAGGSHRGAG